jgi:hypothetical protein
MRWLIRPTIVERVGHSADGGRALGGQLMTSYIVGLRHKTRSQVLSIEAEDALVAALKAKLENPEALITYVRKSNRRGDHRHPHEGLPDRKNARG